MNMSNDSMTSSMISSFLETFSKNMNVVLLKGWSDRLFVLGEKIILHLDKLLHKYIWYYHDIVEAELALSPISKGDQVLHIGCGSIPSTSILISKKTGASITAIDKNAHAIQDARQCLRRIGQSYKITLQQADALNFSYQPYDMIIVSQGVKPQDKLFKRVLPSINKDTCIIFRTMVDAAGNLTTSDKTLMSGFHIEGIASHSNHGLLVSVLLRK